MEVLRQMVSTLNILCNTQKSTTTWTYVDISEHVHFWTYVDRNFFAYLGVRNTQEKFVT